MLRLLQGHIKFLLSGMVLSCVIGANSPTWAKRGCSGVWGCSSPEAFPCVELHGSLWTIVQVINSMLNGTETSFAPGVYH